MTEDELRKAYFSEKDHKQENSETPVTTSEVFRSMPVRTVYRIDNLLYGNRVVDEESLNITFEEIPSEIPSQNS